MHELQARRAPGLRDRPASKQGPRPDEVAQPADRRQAHAGRVRRGEDWSRSSSTRRSRPTGRPPSSCGRSAASSARSCARTRRTTAREVDTGGLPGHHHASTEHAAHRREVGLRRGARPELEGPAGDPEQPQDREGRPGLDPGPAWPQHQQRRGRGHRLSDRRGPCLRRVGQLHVQGQQEVPAPVRRPRRRLAAARIGDQAGRLRHRHRRQDPDRLDDDHGRHHELRRRVHPDPGRQARARPGPPPLGAPVLAQHPGHQGHDHAGPRPHLRPDEGLRPVLPEDGRARAVDGDRDPRGPPDRPARRVRHHRQRRGQDAPPGHRPDHRLERQGGLAAGRRPAQGTQVISPAAAYVITDILAGNTDKKVNPFWGKWAIFDGKTRRPAAYKTGTTSDNRDVAAYGFVAPPADKNAPAIAVGVWMGNSDNTPNDGKLSLDTSAPLWSAIMREVTKGEKIAHLQAAQGHPDGVRGRLHRPQARTVHDQEDHRVLRARARSRRRRRRSAWRPRSTPPAASCGRTAARDRRSPRDSSTSRTSSPTSRPGRRPTRRGPRGRRGARAFAAVRRAPERPTSTTARSRRSAGPGVRRSCRAPCARSTRRRSYCDPFVPPGSVRHAVGRASRARPIRTARHGRSTPPRPHPDPKPH